MLRVLGAAALGGTLLILAIRRDIIQTQQERSIEVTKDLGNPEGVGAKFSIEGMLLARERTKEAVQRIGS